MILIKRLSKVFNERQITKSLVIRNLKDKYVGSFLGIFWAVINPLLIMFAVNFVFSQIMKTDIKQYPLLVLSALLPWYFFVNSLSESVDCFRRNTGILNQFIISREIIPLSITLSNFINFFLGLVIMLPIFILFNTKIAGYLFLLPLIMILHFIFTLGVSMAVSIASIYLRDLAQIISFVIMFLFWLTPIFYPLEMLPQGYRWLLFINPASCYVSLYRSILYGASYGDLYLWFLAIGFAFISFILGYLLIIKKESDILKDI